jgi:hypothetical protein
MHHIFYFIFEIPPCAKKVISVTEFVTLCCVNPFIRKQLAHGAISKIFLVDHFSTSFLGQKY